MIEVANKLTPISTMVERQNGSLSKQPRFTETQQFSRLFRFRRAIGEEPPYGLDSKTRDKWLMSFWRKETLLAGVLNSVIMIDANRGWSITGGRNQVRRFTQICHEANEGNGWRHFVKNQSLAFNATDLGSITELGRETERGPLAAIFSVDPIRCKLTGNPQEPLMYNPSGAGRPQLWSQQDFFRIPSMPQLDEDLRGLGYCAISRALNFAKLMWAVYEHDQEMLGSKMMKGLLLLNNITENQWDKAMRARQEQLTAKERDIYGGVEVLAGVGEFGSVDGKLIALSSLPAGFDQETMTNLLMYGYALAFGYDPREFWPVSAGSLGTGRETQVQAEKATAKGGGDFRLSFQERFQQELPPTIHFEFEERDDAGELLKAQVRQAQADVIDTMSKAGEKVGDPYLNKDEVRQLWAQEGLIPEEWTEQEEEVTATDEEALRQRLLDNPAVRRACEVYENEPIVSYRISYNPFSNERVERELVLWDSGSDALAPSVWFMGEKVQITQRDIERARTNG